MMETGNGMGKTKTKKPLLQEHSQLGQQKGTPRIIVLPEYAVIDENWIPGASDFAYAI